MTNAPAIKASEYQRRRQALMSLMSEGSIAVLPAAEQRFRNRDTEYLFRQDSDFYYLTGFSEPDAVLVLAPGRAHGEVILFCREREACSGSNLRRAPRWNLPSRPTSFVMRFKASGP